jgi:hypothetical protein
VCLPSARQMSNRFQNTSSNVNKDVNANIHVNKEHSFKCLITQALWRPACVLSSVISVTCLQLRSDCLCSGSISCASVVVDGFKSPSPSSAINRSRVPERLAAVSVQQLSVHTDNSHPESLRHTHEWGESVRSTSIRSKRQGDQRGWEG